MNKRRALIAVIVILALAAVAAIFVIKEKAPKEPEPIENIDEAIDEANEDEEFDEFGTGIEFDEEADDAELAFSQSDVANYYGTWRATSDQAIYLYGNVELTINEDKTWSGLVVDERESGTWTYDGTTMELNSEFFNVSLSFTGDGTLVMQEDREGDGDYINTVLTKKE